MRGGALEHPRVVADLALPCRMLEDGQFQEIVSWGYTGDSFVVKVSLDAGAIASRLGY